MRTVAVHSGEPEPLIEDAVGMPIFQSSTYLLGEPEEFDDIRYIRLNNTPNHWALAAKLAALEGTESSVVTPSGTAAISMALMEHLGTGDHILAPESLYGGTRKILDAFERRYGVEVSYVPLEDREAWAEAVQPNTCVFYVESIMNPLLDIGPLDDVVAFSQEHGLVTMIDNTLPTPMNFRPADMGFDVVLHSASKYLNGHSDVVAGVVAGTTDRVHRVRKMMNLAGVCLDPHACFLLQRGLKTLPLRVPAQNQSAGVLARMLSEHPAVKSVRYPGLPEDPSHERARRWFRGAGAMLSFSPRGGVEAAERTIAGLRWAHVAPSLGGLETLVCRPATTSHAGLPQGMREAMGVQDDLVRVSVGIEDAQDLVEDFQRALAA